MYKSHSEGSKEDLSLVPSAPLGTMISSNLHRRALQQLPSPCHHAPHCLISSLGSHCSSKYAKVRQVGAAGGWGSMQNPSSLLCSHSLQEKNPDQEPIPIVLRETVAYLQAHGECHAAQGLLIV